MGVVSADGCALVADNVAGHYVAEASVFEQACGGVPQCVETDRAELPPCAAPGLALLLMVVAPGLRQPGVVLRLSTSRAGLVSNTRCLTALSNATRITFK